VNEVQARGNPALWLVRPPCRLAETSGNTFGGDNQLPSELAP
jgi:hypothetical protein